MKNILYIDDDMHISRHVVEGLEQYGFRVSLTKDYMKLEDELQQSYDAIILDIMMPIIDPNFFSNEELIKTQMGTRTGLVLFEKIRVLNPKMPVLFYTAMPKVEVDEFSTYVRKPELIDSIVEALDVLIRRVRLS